MAFEYTLRHVALTRLKSHLVLVMVLVVALCAWLVWMVRGRIELYVPSERARLEVAANPFPIQAEVTGVVTRCELQLGQHVEAGAVLVELDVRAFALQLREIEATLSGRERTVAAFQRLLDAENEARTSASHLYSDTGQVGRARVAAEQGSASYKQAERKVIDALRSESLATGLETLRAASEHDAAQRQVALAKRQAQLDSVSALTSLRDRNARIAELQKTIAEADADLAAERARRDTLQFEVDRRLIRARVAGTVSDVIPCAAGMTLEPSVRLASLLPDGPVRVVGYFAPARALGRVHAGQPAIVRVDSFPWTQFGVLRAHVDQTGSEARDGQIRVELALDRPSNPAIPIEHGLVATVEIRTEALSPAHLLLRMTGQLLRTDEAARTTAP